MNVAIDATPLSAGVGGIARYTAELHRALAAVSPDDRYTLLSDQPFPGRTTALPDNWFDRRWWLAGLPREMRRIGAELFHGTHFSVPYLPLRPSVMTIHDLSPWKDPRWHCAAQRVRRRAPFLAGLGIATLIVTPSEAVRAEVIGRWCISPGRVVAVPLAASAHFRPASNPRGDYFLYVGALEPRKNLPMLIEAWRAVRNTREIDLVLAGKRRADFPELPDEPGLRVLGEVSEADLPALYSGATACLYPSLYEGFGLPVLEAMQCGAAVIASRDAAISEVAAGAAVQVDASDTRGWAEAMLSAASNPAWTETLRTRSLLRARSFSWERTARLTRQVYEEALLRFGS
jgi:glycosyltransferase involved in cell wall biosynthesis